MPQLDLSFLFERRTARRVALGALVFAVLGVAYALLAPKWFESVATLVPAKAQRGQIPALLGSDAAGLALGLDSGAGGGADVARIAAVLQSVSVTDAAIANFDLKKRYAAPLQEDARKILWEHCEVRPLLKPSLVEVACEDREAEFAQRLVQHFADYGNEVFRRVSVGAASEQVRGLERRVAELRQNADESTARLREFQETHRIVDIESQARAVVSAMASLQSQRISKQMELDYAQTFASRDEASTRQLRNQIDVVDQKLRALEDTPPRARASRDRADVFPSALAVPRIRAELETLYRERRVAEATLVFALERLEGAKADEAKDVSTFLILDAPTLPTKRSRPKRALTVAVFALAGAALVVATEWWRSVTPRARPATSHPAGPSIG